MDNHRLDSMLSLYRAQIPERLRSSEFFRSLSDNDDEDELILVPADCFRETDEVRSYKDLISELKVIRFWGLPVSFEVFMYCLNHVDEFDSLISDLSQEWKELKSLMLIASSDIDAFKMNEAVRSGSPHLVDHLRRIDKNRFCFYRAHVLKAVIYKSPAVLSHFITNIDSIYLNSYAREDIFVEAVRQNCPECVLVLVDKWKVLHDSAVPEIRYSYNECLEMLRQRGPLYVNLNVLGGAIYAGNLEMVRICLASPTFSPEERQKSLLVTEAVTSNKFAALQLLHGAGYPASAECAKLAMFGQKYSSEEKALEMLQYLHQTMACPLVASEVAMAAALNNQTLCLCYVLDEVAPRQPSGPVDLVELMSLLEQKLTLRAIPSVDVWRALHRRGAPLPHSILHKVIVEGKRDEAEYLASEVFPDFVWDTDALFDLVLSSRGPRVAALMLLRAHGLVWPVDTLERCIECAGTDCLKYVLEQGAPRATNPALRSARTNLLPVDMHVLLTEAGCPWSVKTADENAFARFGNIERVRALRSRAGLPWTRNTVNLVVTNSYITALRYVLKDGCPTYPDNYVTVIKAVKPHETVPYLELLLQHGCVWDGSALVEAARMDRKDAREFANKHHLPGRDEEEPRVARVAWNDGDTDWD